MRRFIQAEQIRCTTNLGTSLQQPSTSTINTMSEATTSPVQNKIPRRLIPSLLTCTDNTINSKESLYLIDSLIPETVNNIDSTTISNVKIGTYMW